MDKRWFGTHLHRCECCLAEVQDIDWTFYDINNVEWCDACVASYYGRRIK